MSHIGLTRHNNNASCGALIGTFPGSSQRHNSYLSSQRLSGSPGVNSPDDRLSENRLGQAPLNPDVTTARRTCSRARQPAGSQSAQLLLKQNLSRISPGQYTLLHIFGQQKSCRSHQDRMLLRSVWRPGPVGQRKTKLLRSPWIVSTAERA